MTVSASGNPARQTWCAPQLRSLSESGAAQAGANEFVTENGHVVGAYNNPGKGIYVTYSDTFTPGQIAPVGPAS